MNRRHLIQSLAALGLVAAAEPVVEPVRRYWFGHTFEPEPYWVPIEPAAWKVVIHGPEHLGVYGWRAAAWRDRPGLPPFQWRDYPAVTRREQYTTPTVYEPMVPTPGYSARDEAIRILLREIGKSDKPIIL